MLEDAYSQWSPSKIEQINVSIEQEKYELFIA